jgi:hypothetical protein
MSNQQQSKSVTVRMPAEMIAQIDEMAIETMRSRTAQIVLLLKQVLSQHQKPEND